MREYGRHFTAAAALLNDFGDRFRYVIDVAGVERGDADAAGLDRVDRVILTQALHLLLGQAGVREHAALSQDEAEIGARRALLDLAHQVEAHALDAIAHDTQFLLPLRAQFG